MSGRGIKLLKLAGIQISIDYTWFIVFVLFAWSLAYGYFPFRNPGFGQGTYFFMGVLSALLLFACVLIHELSHSITANKLGLDISEITLFIFGGVANLKREPDDAKTELKVAIAGPAASAVLAVFFWGVAKAVNEASYPVTNAIISYLALINLVLLIFNMIPGFPLDGGRVFRAIWWARTGDLDSSTRAASSIGKGFAIFLIVTGFFQIFMGNFTGGLWSVLIGVFVQQAAESGYQQVVMKKALAGVKVQDLMTRGVVTVDEGTTLSETVDKFIKFHYMSFPVRSNGHVAGLVTLSSVKHVDKDKWENTYVRDVMLRLNPEDALKPEDSALDALMKMINENMGRFPVIDNKGELAGIISRRDIMKMLEFKAGLQK